MFYYNLDGNALDNKTGNQMAVGGQMLTAIQPVYWSGTGLSSSIAWVFKFGYGIQGGFGKGSNGFAWAVRPGDVAAAPEPGSLLLIGLGALGLGWARRKGRRR